MDRSQSLCGCGQEMTVVEANARICGEAKHAKQHEHSLKKFTESGKEQTQVAQLLAPLPFAQELCVPVGV